jgi:hypothetical protein
MFVVEVEFMVMGRFGLWEKDRGHGTVNFRIT